MRFLGKVWRLLVGVKDALVLLFMLLFFGLLYAALSARPTLGSADQGALVLAIGGTIVEQPVEADPFAVLSGSQLLQEHRLRDLVHALDAAAAASSAWTRSRRRCSWRSCDPLSTANGSASTGCSTIVPPIASTSAPWSALPSVGRADSAA